MPLPEAMYGSFDPNRSFIDQAQAILIEEGVVPDASKEALVVMPGTNLQEAAHMLIDAASEIPLDHIT